MPSGQYLPERRRAPKLLEAGAQLIENQSGGGLFVPLTPRWELVDCARLVKAKKPALIICGLLLLLSVGGCSSSGERPSGSTAPGWTRAIETEVSSLGYRNWIVIGDAAFPIHSRRGVRTITIKDEIPAILDEVLESLERTQNVTPRIYLPRELSEIPEDSAPGIESYRKVLDRALRGYPTREMEFRSLSLLLEDSANTFTVVVFKSTTALPYSGIFIELDSGYWDREAERELRERMEAKRRREST